MARFSKPFRLFRGLPPRPVRTVTRSAGGLICCLLLLAGCRVASTQSNVLPGKQTLVRDQLVVHSDFQLPSQHRLLRELAARRHDIAERLALPLSDEPIHVYIFQDAERFHSFMDLNYPLFARRRAFFIKTDTSLRVLAYWGDRIAEDLRHEVTHGYLHSVVPNLPLWLDEGLAEYFETPRGVHGLNEPHVYLLARQFRREAWEPDLQRLETLQQPEEMTQQDYAESWLWVHFLIEGRPELRAVLQQQLQRLRLSGEAAPLSNILRRSIEDPASEVAAHLKQLAEQLELD